jgi:hypothetical protein
MSNKELIKSKKSVLQNNSEDKNIFDKIDNVEKKIKKNTTKKLISKNTEQTDEPLCEQLDNKNNIDNIDNKHTVVLPKKNKIKKDITNEQILLLDELKNILEVNGKINSFLSFTVDSKKDLILNEFLNKTKTAYPSKVWLCGLNYQCKGHLMNYVRAILKHHNLILTYKEMKRKGDDNIEKKGPVLYN